MSGTPVTVWHLELPSRAAFRPSGRPPAFRLGRLTLTDAALAHVLYREVGGRHRWVDRLSWKADGWQARLADPAVELWAADLGGERAGYFELARLGDGRVEICYLGLVPAMVGRGHGGPLLDAAVERAWAMGATRVYVNTCSLDHPAALPNYRGRGFVVVRQEVKSE